MSSARKSVASLLACCAAVLMNGTGLAQNKKKDKAGDEKTQLNKALLLAARDGKLETVKELLKKGADIEYRDPGAVAKTPLIKAIQSGKIEVVKFLLENGADIHYPARSNIYPITYCCNSKVEMLEFLLSRGGDKDIERGIFRLLVALIGHGGPPESIPLIIKAGGNPDLFQGPVTPLINTLKYDLEGRRPELVRAYVKALIENNADVNLQDKNGISPLQWANKRGDQEIIEMLKKAGAKE